MFEYRKGVFLKDKRVFVEHSWQTFLDLFRMFRKPDVEELEVEWACILTMLAIESSTHLEYS